MDTHRLGATFRLARKPPVSAKIARENGAKTKISREKTKRFRQKSTNLRTRLRVAVLFTRFRELFKPPVSAKIARTKISREKTKRFRQKSTNLRTILRVAVLFTRFRELFAETRTSFRGPTQCV